MYLKNSLLYIVRSSDGVARAVIQDGHVRFLSPSAVPEEALILNAQKTNIQTIPFRDSLRPIIIIGKGDL